MSLFPAYSRIDNVKNDNSEINIGATAASRKCQWLENNSFAVNDNDLQQTQQNINEESKCVTNSGSILSANLNEFLDVTNENSKSSLKRHKEPTYSKESNEKLSNVLLNTEFTGDEDFYVDKNKARQYNNIKTLHRPARPKYRRHFAKQFGTHHLKLSCDIANPVSRIQRYYNSKHLTDDAELQKENQSISENDYTTLLGALNRKTMGPCKDIKPWLEIVELQDKNPYRWSRLKIAEKKIDYLQRALQYNPRNEKLYRVYIEIISATYPSHDVSKMLESLLSKDPYCVTLWQAQIMTTQGTMASCTVPKVLDIYQRCMRKMFNSRNDENCNIKDSVTLRLFNNCSLFLRQAGLYEQLVALIKLAIELNVANAANICKDLVPLPDDEKTLIDYEEVILQSGMPMNEIWLRIEKLRQSFNFLPIPVTNESSCSDPQRIVFNEDICHYVYPLKSKENSFHLILIICRLFKIPFIGTHCLSQQFEGDTDAIEELLTCLLTPTYSMPLTNHELQSSIYELVKELCVSPTFLNHNIANEIYTRCLRNFIMNCANTYSHNTNDENKRLSLLLIWCRFERLLLIIETLSKKVTTDYIKNGQSRFKSMLKQKQNRNILYLYVEYALYEINAKSERSTIENIFLNILNTQDNDEANTFKTELLYVYVTYAEILIGWRDVDKASRILSAYALGIHISTLDDISDVQKLIALKNLHKKLEQIINVETNVCIQVLEQHLIPDLTILLLKAYILLQVILQQKQQAVSYLDDLLKTKFVKACANERHRYLRELIYELYLYVLQLPIENSNCNTNSFVSKTILQALEEYPRNMNFLYEYGNQSTTIVWYKLKSDLLRINPSIMSIMFLIAIMRHRFIEVLYTNNNNANIKSFINIEDNTEYHEIMVRRRTLNLFKILLRRFSSSSPLNTLSPQRNCLFWRCYLRCLSDQTIPFEVSRKCLLSALDECPWSKALYIDGIMYVPQEVQHLQDLILEKQLRIYALPEELEILREQ